MSGLDLTSQYLPGRERLGQQLRRLRDGIGRPGWEVAAAAKMDSTLLSKIETGKRLPTREQLVGLANYFNVPVEPLEERRLAEAMLRLYGDHPGLAGATAIVREEAGEYGVNKKGATANKPVHPVNKREKIK